MVVAAASVSFTSLSCDSEAGNQVAPVSTALPALATVPATTTAARASSQAPDVPQTSAEAQLASLLAKFDLDREFAVIDELASDAYAGRKSGRPGEGQAAEYIASQFSRLELVPWSSVGLTSLTQPFSMRGFETQNVIGFMPGSGGATAGYVILAAHHDHLGTDTSGRVFNGADDNAAGVAAVIEAATMIREAGITPVKNLVFCSFSGEEEGQFGSKALGSLISAQGLTNQVQMFNIDGIGATGGDYLGVWDEGAANAAPIILTLEKAGSLVGEAVRREGTDTGSDAQSFDWQFGIPAVTIDWNWGQDESLFHPYYHTVDDDAAHINKDALTRASRVAIAGFWLAAAAQ